MDKEQKNTEPNSTAEKENAPASSAATNRVKRMRSWLGSNGTIGPTIIDDDNEPLLYGEGHSGWNR